MKLALFTSIALTAIGQARRGNQGYQTQGQGAGYTGGYAIANQVAGGLKGSVASAAAIRNDVQTAEFDTTGYGAGCRDGKCSGGDTNCPGGHCNECTNGNCGGGNHECSDGNCHGGGHGCKNGNCPRGGRGGGPWPRVRDDLMNLDPLEDLQDYTGKVHARINLIQCIPAGDTCDTHAFGHIRKVAHFMLDGFVLDADYSHAGVILGGEPTSQVIVDPNDASGQSNVTARKNVALAKKLGGTVNMVECVSLARRMIAADERNNTINVVLIHTDGNFPITGNSLALAIGDLQNTPRLIPMVVSYGHGLYDSQNDLQKRGMLQFAECVDLEFCPNLIPAKYTPASLISTQLAVKQYIATAVRAIPPAHAIDANSYGYDR